MEQVATIASDGVAYFQDRNPDGTYTDAEFLAYESVAKLMMQSTNVDSQLLTTIVHNEVYAIFVINWLELT